MTDEQSSESITLDSVLELEPDSLTEEQSALLNENKADLTDEQREKFGIKDEEEVLNPDDINPETRFKTPETKKPKEEEEEIDSEDEEAIGKVLDKKLKPFEKLVVSQTDKAEVNEFVAENPEMAKYKAVALKYMEHPVYRNIPVSGIMAIVSAKDQQRIGAIKERAAQEKAKNTQGANNQPARKPGGGTQDWHNASKESFDEQMAKVKGYQT